MARMPPVAEVHKPADTECISFHGHASDHGHGHAGTDTLMSDILAALQHADGTHAHLR